MSEMESPHWVVQFSDCSAFVVPDTIAESQVVVEAEKQHGQLGLTGKFGYAFHVPSGKFIHGSLTTGDVPFLFVP